MGNKGEASPNLVQHGKLCFTSSFSKWWQPRVTMFFFVSPCSSKWFPVTNQAALLLSNSSLSIKQSLMVSLVQSNTALWCSVDILNIFFLRKTAWKLPCNRHYHTHWRQQAKQREVGGWGVGRLRIMSGYGHEARKQGAGPHGPMNHSS